MSVFNLGSIRGLLGLDESNYVRGMINADAANEIFGAGVVNFVNNPLLGTIRLLKGAAVGAAELVSETASLNQELFRMSQRTGASARTLSGLKAEFEDLKIPAEALEKVFVVLNRRMIESASNEQVAELFRKLGLNARDANGQLKDTDTFLRQASDALAQLATPTERMTALQQLFGEESFKAYTILANGSKTIEDTIRFYDSLGRVIDDEVARSSNAAAAAIGNMEHGFIGIKQTLVNEYLRGVAGDVDSVTEASQRLVAITRDELGPVARDLGEKTPPALQAIARYIDEFGQGVEILKGAGEIPVLKQIIEAGQFLTRIGNPIGDGLRGIESLGNRIWGDSTPARSGEDMRGDFWQRQMELRSQGAGYTGYELRVHQLMRQNLLLARMAI